MNPMSDSLPSSGSSVLQRQETLARIATCREKLEIPIRDEAGAEIGRLCPVTTAHLQAGDILESMSRWRNQYRAFFLTQFPATAERTQRWLERVVLPNPAQLLFLIYSGGQLIGQYGFKEFNGSSAFVDNLLRGERGGHPLVMRCAVVSLVNWLFDVLRVEQAYGYVFADNAMSLKLHRDVGFAFAEKLPLRKQADGEEIRWVVGQAGETSPDNRYYQKVVAIHRLAGGRPMDPGR